MYQNKVSLIGFLGSDPELRNNGSGRFTTLSVATKSSYRKDEAYVARTEWHRCIVFGKLSEFPATLKKGTHLQVEGELRSREYVNPKTGSAQRIWEVRVGSILKLDRAAKASAPEEPVEESPQEEAEPLLGAHQRSRAQLAAGPRSLPEEIAMTSKSIVAFGRDHEASPPSCSMFSGALDRKLRGRHQRCHSWLFGQGFNSQVLGFSQGERQRRLMIDPVLEVANAAA